jgi:hypothetical protein
MSSFGVDKAVTFRQPATANLMIDSADRPSGTPWDFQLTSVNNYGNGFFSRIAATEIVLEWCMPNIAPAWGNTTMAVDISGTGSEAFHQTIAITLPTNFYVVSQVLANIQNRITAAVTGTTITCVAGITSIGTGIGSTNAILSFLPGTLTNQMDISGAVSTQSPIAPAGTYFIPVICPDLRPYRYLDFVCENLTYAQDVKDNSSAPYNRDVLARWYFAYDEAPNLDATDMPILMGYSRFVLRRIFNPPKQIKWDANLPVGNLRFNVYDNNGELVDVALGSEWLMTLQLSEN